MTQPVDTASKINSTHRLSENILLCTYFKQSPLIDHIRVFNETNNQMITIACPYATISTAGIIAKSRLYLTHKNMMTLINSYSAVFMLLCLWKNKIIIIEPIMCQVYYQGELNPHYYNGDINVRFYDADTFALLKNHSVRIEDTHRSDKLSQIINDPSYDHPMSFQIVNDNCNHFIIIRLHHGTIKDDRPHYIIINPAQETAQLSIGWARTTPADILPGTHISFLNQTKNTTIVYDLLQGTVSVKQALQPAVPPIKPCNLPEPFSITYDFDQVIVSYYVNPNSYAGAVKLHPDCAIRSVKMLYDIMKEGINGTNKYVTMTISVIDQNTIMLAFDINMIFCKEWIPITLHRQG